MCSKEIAAAITALAAIITEKLSPEQSALLAAIFVQLGDTIATIVTANDICKTK